MNDTIKLIFTHILTRFTNLEYLNICSYSVDYQRLVISLSSSPVISSTLLILQVCLDNISDCYCLLDGRLNRLHTLYVNMQYISSLPTTINSKVSFS